MWNARKSDRRRTPPAPRERPERGPRRTARPVLTAAVAAGFLAAALAAAAAQDMQVPTLTHINPDWDAVAAEIDAMAAPEGAPQRDFQSIASLNRATGELFPDIAASAVPVLLPFDTSAFLADRAAGVTGKRADDYLSGFHLSPFFLPGPSGYDAMFTVRASELPELGIAFSGRIEIFVSGFSLLYDIDPPARMTERAVKGLDSDFLGIRHVLLENYARNTFTRYGVPYAVSILCFDGSVARYHMITCRDAGKVAERFLKALHVAGGAPTAAPLRAASTIERPQGASADFTYYGPGNIIAGTGFRGNGGRADYTVYSKMRFPLSDAPAYANSQSFMNWGDCDSTGRVSVGMAGHVPIYRCRIGGPVLLKDESAGGNYAYPWRDNFCEHRYFMVGECPGGLGHQGQDIRPSSCKQRFEGGSCEPYQHDVAAVSDGMVLRSSGQMPVYLFVNAPDEHIRFRYLHMSPRQLDEDGVVSGRVLARGEVFGKVGSYFQHERATTYHLHFDMQVPTKYGWMFVNPYMTLVAAYERLIGARGTELNEAPRVAIAAGSEPPLPIARPRIFGIRSEGDEGIEGLSHARSDEVAPEPASGAASPRLGNGARVATTRPIASTEPAAAVRSVGHGVPRESGGAGYPRGHLHASHAGPKAGHHRL